jgi:ATP-binding cassette, subfamily B, multidrug efflux pump
MLKTLSTLWPYVRRYRKGLALGIGALLIKDALLAALPLVIKNGIDSLMAGFRLSLVLEFAGLLIGLSALKGLFQYWMRVILIGVSRDMEFDLREDMCQYWVAC